MDDQKYVTRLMRARCSKGTMENYLNIDIDHGIVVGADVQPLMNANDHVSGRHVIHFGCCESDQNPERMFRKALVGRFLGGAIADALEDVGIMTCKCKPNTPNPWEFVNEDSIVEGAPALMVCSTLTCRYGGVIEIIDPDGDGDIVVEPPEVVNSETHDSEAGQQETAQGPDTSLLGMGATIVGQYSSELIDAAGGVMKAQADDLFEAAMITLRDSAGTVDDMLRAGSLTGWRSTAAALIQKGNQYSLVANKAIPVVGAAVDFGLQVVGGEDVIDAGVKTVIHTGIGAWVGSQTTAMIIAAAGGPPGLVIGVGVAATVGLCCLADWAYDNRNDLPGAVVDVVENVGAAVVDTANLVGDVVGDAVDYVGDAVVGFWGDIVGAFS